MAGIDVEFARPREYDSRVDGADSVRQIIDKFDVDDPVEFGDVERALRPPQVEGGAPPPVLTPAHAAEWAVFLLYLSRDAKSTPWGGAFGPSWSGTTESGAVWESPARESMTGEVIEYWRGRARSVRQAQLRSRYAHAAWDLARTTRNSSADFQDARIAIDGYLQSLVLATHPVEAVTAWRHAVRLAWTIRDADRARACYEAAIALLGRIGRPESPGLCLFALEDLVLERIDPVLTEQQTSAIVSSLENCFACWGDSSNPQFNPHAARDGGRLLAKHYRKRARSSDVARVVAALISAARAAARDGTGMQAHAWIEDVVKDAQDAGLTTEAESLITELSLAGEKAKSEMQEYGVPIEIDNEMIDARVADLTSGSLEEAIGRMAGAFLVRRNRVEETIRDGLRESPLISMISMSIGDEFTRARVGGVQDDWEGRIAYELALLLRLQSPFLQAVLIRVIAHYAPTAEALVDLLYLSPVFDDKRRGILTSAISRWLAGDHVSAVHTLVPQLEHALRNLLRQLGGQPTHRDREEVYRAKDLGRLLADPVIASALGEDVHLYLGVVLTDQRGWNVRHQVCHGLVDHQWFTAAISNQVIHIFLVLSQLRSGPASNGGAPRPAPSPPAL